MLAVEEKEVKQDSPYPECEGVLIALVEDTHADDGFEKAEDGQSSGKAG